MKDMLEVSSDIYLADFKCYASELEIFTNVEWGTIVARENENEAHLT